MCKWFFPIVAPPDTLNWTITRVARQTTGDQKNSLKLSAQVYYRNIHFVDWLFLSRIYHSDATIAGEGCKIYIMLGDQAFD
jgi:hypothetical protein